MMEAARNSETLVNFYQTARRYNPEDSHKEFYSPNISSIRETAPTRAVVIRQPTEAHKT
jgi:hypothetical protein